MASSVWLVGGGEVNGGACVVGRVDRASVDSIVSGMGYSAMLCNIHTDTHTECSTCTAYLPGCKVISAGHMCIQSLPNRRTGHIISLCMFYMDS